MLVMNKGKVEKSFPLQDINSLNQIYADYYQQINKTEISDVDLININNNLNESIKAFKTDEVTFEGKSLVSSAELTAKAFSNGIMGEYGGKLVAIALLLFAFSTAITWCYYGDRSTAYIFGERGVFWYRNFYVLCFILAAVIDTTIVWNIAYVVVALVSIPNLIALFVLRGEMKQLTNDFISKS
jgi:Na+/alanine symporter